MVARRLSGNGRQQLETSRASFLRSKDLDIQAISSASLLLALQSKVYRVLIPRESTKVS